MKGVKKRNYMANVIQKIIYNLSATAPLCWLFALVWYIQKGTSKLSIILIVVGALLFLSLNISFDYGKKHLSPIRVRTNDISPNDGWLIAYIISYFIPFTNMIVDDIDLRVCGLISCLLIVIIPFINSAIPNPILFVRGYHFYQVSAENGISGYVLISKRKLRKKQDIKCVNRIFEFLLLDDGGK